MEQLVQISYISAIHTSHFLLGLLERFRVGCKFFEELQHCCNFLRGQLFVIYHVASRAKAAVNSITGKVTDTFARWRVS
jgi:hypothetical protein